jgi:hypothetical protein
VRLKQHQQPVELAAARGFKRGLDFDGVVAVVVNDRDVVDRAFDVEAAADPAEVGKPPPDEFRRDVEVQGYRGGGRGVANIVDSGRMRQRKRPRSSPL